MRRDRVRGRQLALVVLIGVALAGVGVIENVALGWRDIWPQVFLTVGSAFALGGVLFVLQRSWVEEVSDEVQQAGEDARSAVHAIEARAAEIEEKLEARRPVSLGELRDLVSTSAAKVTDDRRNTIEVLKNDLSFENLSPVLTVAQDLNAIAYGFRGRAAGAFDGLRLAAWLETEERGFPIEPFIELRVIPLVQDASQSDPTAWRAGQAASDAITALTAACQRANLPSTPPAFDPAEGFRRLVESLDAALSIRQGSAGPRLRGALIEMLDEAWALTTAGLEARHRSLLVPLADFVDYVYDAQDPEEPPYRREKDPGPPELVQPNVWEYLKSAVWAYLPTSPPPGMPYYGSPPVW